MVGTVYSVIAYVREWGGRWGEIAKRVPMVIDDVNYCRSTESTSSQR